MAYKDSLANVDATLSTTDKLLKVSDYKKWLSLIATLLILTVFLILVLSRYRGKKICKNLSNFEKSCTFAA